MDTWVILVIIVIGLFVLSCINGQIENCKIRAHNRRFDEIQARGRDEEKIEQQAGAPLQYELGHTTREYSVPMYPSAPQFVTVSW